MFLVKSHMEQLVNAVENCSRSIVLHMRKHDGLVSYITPLSVEKTIANQLTQNWNTEPLMHNYEGA